jgi:hypothetical protein
MDELFAKKTREAHAIVLDMRNERIPKNDCDIPFEVNKVLHQIKEETARREKLFKKKKP